MLKDLYATCLFCIVRLICLTSNFARLLPYFI